MITFRVLLFILFASQATAGVPVFRVNPITTNTPAGMTNVIQAIAGSSGTTLYASNVVSGGTIPISAVPTLTAYLPSSAGRGTDETFTNLTTVDITTTSGLDLRMLGSSLFQFRAFSDHMRLTNNVQTEWVEFSGQGGTFTVGNGANTRVFNVKSTGNFDFTGVATGNGGSLTNLQNSGFIITTNATPPVSTATIKAWADVILSSGATFKMPLYQ